MYLDIYNETTLCVCKCVLWNKHICTTYQFWVVAYSSHQVVKLNPEGVSEENRFTLNSISNVLSSDETAARVSPPAGSHDDQQQEKLGGSFSVHWNSHKTQHNKRVKKKQKASSSFLLPVLRSCLLHSHTWTWSACVHLTCGYPKSPHFKQKKLLNLETRSRQVNLTILWVITKLLYTLKDTDISYWMKADELNNRRYVKV